MKKRTWSQIEHFQRIAMKEVEDRIKRKDHVTIVTFSEAEQNNITNFATVTTAKS